MRPWHRIALGWLIAGLVVVTIGFTLRDSLHEAGTTLAGIAPLTFCALVLPGALMMVATGASFALLVLPRDSDWVQRSKIVGIYLTAQIIKYLPGRVWGLVYQLKRLTEQVHMSQGIVASVNHMILTILISMLFLGLAFDVPGAWSLMLFGASLGLLWTQRGGIAAYLTWVTNIPLTTLAPLPMQTVLGIGTCLALEWAFYLMVWTGLFMLLSMPPEPEMILALASLYAGSWIFGSLVSLVPGGLGVREGGFVMLGLVLGIPEPKLMAIAILARLILTLAETMTGTLAAAYLQKTTCR